MASSLTTIVASAGAGIIIGYFLRGFMRTSIASLGNRSRVVSIASDSSEEDEEVTSKFPICSIILKLVN